MPTQGMVPPGDTVLGAASNDQMSEDDVFAYVHKVSEARGSEEEIGRERLLSCEDGDVSLTSAPSDKRQAPLVKALPRRLSMKEHTAAAKKPSDLVLRKLGEREKAPSQTPASSIAVPDHDMTEMELDTYVMRIAAPASRCTTASDSERQERTPALAYHAVKANESAKLEAEEKEECKSLEEEAAMLAYKLFASDELASLEEKEAEEMRLLRAEESEEDALKVLHVLFSEAWQRLGKYQQAWYVEKARWEIAQRRSNSPTTTSLSALRAPLAGVCAS